MAKTASLTLLVVASLAAQSAAHPEYRAKIPNALNVKGVDAIGHVNKEGGGARNKFGQAFEAAGLSWTKELCQADSDGDGQTNGQELGDPCCEWVETSNAKTLWTEGVSAPGDATSKSDPKLWASVKCATASSTNSTGGTGAAAGSAANASAPAAGDATTPEYGANSTNSTGGSATTPSTTTKAPAATTPAPTKSAAVGLTTGLAALAISAVAAAVM